ncbi:MAG: Crp/Fnr family transcriptional regulator [Candidatus Firestonebacteria bacterium]|nr:Crp/Fnr family transcriptional regulator [Candidatus Firestonebacteria bacterium]
MVQIMTNNFISELLTSKQIILNKSICKIQFFESGDKLFCEDDIIKGCFLIKKGTINITKNTSSDEKITLFTLSSGDIAGEMAFGQIERHFTNAEVMEKTITIFYEKTYLNEFLNSNIEIALPVFMEIAKIMSYNMRQIDVNFKDFFMWSLNKL